MGFRMLDHSVKSLNRLFILFIVLGVLLVANVSNIKADVPEAQGETLQLYSGWTTAPPNLDGFLVTTSTEWDDAYARELPLSDGSTVTLFLMNDATNLYVGLSYPHGNNGSPNRVTLYFDQGDGGGENNDQLDANDENMVSTDRSFTTPTDRYWNGTTWVNDTSIDFYAVDQYFTNIFQWEFRIPLANGTAGDLNVNGGDGTQAGDELGFLLEILKQPSSTVYWSDTNMNPNNSSIGNGWGEIRLGKNPKLHRTLGASINVNGNPSIDGVISEDAYRGCYQRDIVLTNYQGNTLNGRFYGIHSVWGNDVYVSFRIWDGNYHSDDYMQVYFEQTNPGPTDSRNYLLEDNQENSMRISSSGATTDYFFRRNVGSSGQWVNDAIYSDSVSGSGDSSYSSIGGYWDYEFRVSLSSGVFDLDRVLDDALLGFQIRFHDANQTSGRQDFYWDVAVNSDVEYLDETGNNNYSIGWASLQLGAPYLQIVHPENNAILEGTYPIDAYVVPGTSSNITNCEYQIEGDSTWTTMARVATSDWWTANWDTTTKSDGLYELRVRVTDSNALQVTQIIRITINNAGLVNSAPEINVTAPAPGSVVNDLTTITFNIDPDSSVTLVSTEISVDGDAWIPVTVQPSAFGNWDDGSYDLDTLPLNNGAHIFRVRAQDSNGRWGYSDILLVIVSNNVDVELTAPNPGSVVNGDSVSVTFNIDPEVNETIARAQISIDGGAWTDVTSQPTSGGAWNDGEHTWNTLTFENGSHTIQIRAEDSNGHWGYSDIRTVIVSNNVLVELTAPNPGSVVNGDNVSVTFNIDPEVNESIVRAQISMDGGVWTDVTTTPTSGGNWDDGEHTWDTLSFVNGSHTIQIRAENSNGHWGYSSIRTVIVSNNIAVTIATPAASSVVSGNDIAVIFNIDPEVNEQITSTQISIDGSAWIDVTTVPTSAGDWDDGEYLWNTLSYVNGAHSLQIRAQDSNGRWGYSQIVLVFVNNLIEVKIISPEASEIVSSEVAIAFSIDPVVGEVINKTEISIDGADWIEVSTAPTEEGDWDNGLHMWNTSTVADGSHTFIIRAQDSNNRYGYSVTRLVLVDNTAPVISNIRVLYPFGKTTVVTGDKLIITARIHDVISGLDDETIILDSFDIDGETHTMLDDGTNGDEIEGDGVYSFEIIITASGNVTLPFTVGVSDNEGNATTVVRGTVDLLTRTKASGGGCSMGDGGSNNTTLIVLMSIMILLLVVKRWRIPKSVALLLMVLVFAFAVNTSIMAQDSFGDDDEGWEWDDDYKMETDDDSAVETEDDFEAGDDDFGAESEETMSEPVKIPIQTQPGMLQTQTMPAQEIDFKNVFLRSPLMIKTNDFLHSIVSIPTMEVAKTLDVGDMFLRFGYNYSSGSYEEINGTTSVNTDVFFGETFLYFALGLTENLEIRVMLPYSGWNGDLELINNGQSAFDQSEIGDGLGSLRVGAKFFIYEFDFGLELGGALTAKLPSGSKEDYQTTDGMDISPSLLFDYQHEKYTFHLNFGMTFVGTQSVFREEANIEFKNVFFFGVSINYLMQEDIAILLQAQGNTSIMGDVDLDAAKGFIMDAMLGARFFLPENLYIELAFGMGLTESSAGFLMHMSLVMAQF